MSDAESIAVPMPRSRHPGRRGDAALLRAVDRGEEAALAELFRRHWPVIHRAAWLVTHDAQAAEDIAQEAFLAAVRALDTFDRRRPFGPWFHRIVINRAIDWARARALRHEVGDDPLAVAPARTDPAPQKLSEGLMHALAGLPPEHRAVVVLRHLLEYTPGEIAKMLDLPRGTVNSRLRRGLDALRGDLAEERQ
jgi:RNA polymerase sigma-70 factor, ECF subfamily